MPSSVANSSKEVPKRVEEMEKHMESSTDVLETLESESVVQATTPEGDSVVDKEVIEKVEQIEEAAPTRYTSHNGKYISYRIV